MTDAMDEEASQDATDGQESEEHGQEAAEDHDDTPNGADGQETFPRSYVEKLRRESASYRERAQKSDTAMSRLADLTITSATSGILIDPSDLRYDPETMTDDEGYPDPDKIKKAASELVKQKPHLADRRPRGDIGQGAKKEEVDVDLAGILRERAG